MPLRHRPTGVTVIAILNILTGALLLLASISMFLAVILADDPAFKDIMASYDVPGWIISQLPVVLGAMGVAFLTMGILAMIISFGFLNGKRWSWYLAVICGFLSIGMTVTSILLTGGLVNILSLVLGMAVPVLIIAYLFQPDTKAWFSIR